MLCYELLSGHTPYGTNASTGYERERIVCEVDPPAPSVAVERVEDILLRGTTTQTVTPQSVSALRREAPAQLRRRLRGDLDNIVLMAMNRDPQRRHASVREFSEDIHCFLRGLPVKAQRPTATYRFKKFVRRTRVIMAATSAGMIALAIGAAGTVLGLRQARQERDTAVRTSVVLRDALGFLQEVLASVNPYREGGDTNVLGFLGNATQRIETELGDQPGVEASVRYAIGRAYAGLWRFNDAKAQAEIALHLNEKLHGPEHESVADCLTLLGRSMNHVRDSQALQIQKRALELRTKLYGVADVRLAENKAGIGFALCHTVDPPDWEAAERWFREAIAMYRAAPNADRSLFAMALHGLGAMLNVHDKSDQEVESLFQEALKNYGASPTPNERNRSECLSAYSYYHRQHARAEQEREMLREYLVSTPPLFAEDGGVRAARWRFAQLQRDRGYYTDAANWYRKALAAEASWRAQVAPFGRPRFAAVANLFAADLDLPRTASIVERFLMVVAEIECPDNHRLSERVVDFASFLTERGHLDRADSILHMCEDYQRTEFPGAPLTHACTANARGALLMAAGETRHTIFLPPVWQGGAGGGSCAAGDPPL